MAAADQLLTSSRQVGKFIRGSMGILASLKDLVEQGKFGSMAEAVRDSLAVNRALQNQAKQGFTEIVVRDPETKQERVMVLPALPAKQK